MEPEYDVFVSYAHNDREPVCELAAALRAEGLRVFIDDTEVEPFASIQERVARGIAGSKVLLAWYSDNYARSRACQWELAAAYLCGSGDRVCVVNAALGTEHIQPRSLLDRLLADAGCPGKLAQDIGRRAAAFTDSLGENRAWKQARCFGFQPAGSNRFVGRVRELWAIHDALQRSASAMLSGVVRSIVQIRGLGGIGKSLLAEEYALRFGAAFPGGIFWLKAFGGDSNKTVQDREADRMQQITEFAAQVPLAVEQKLFPEVWAMLAAELRKAPCLWIVDDLPSGLTREELSRWLSPHASIPTLITIPDLSHGDLGVQIDLDALAPEEALLLLRSHKLRDRGGDGAAALAEALERHPLAIEIAASYLEFRDGAVSCAAFAEQLRNRTRDELEFAAKVKHSPGLATALSATMRHLSATATDLLVLASVLASAPIPAEMIDAAFAQLYRCSQDDALLKRLEATAETDRFALSRLDPVRPEARRVHRLVSRLARQQAASPERVAAIRAAVVASLNSFALQGLSYARIFRLGLESTHARELSVNPGTPGEAALLVTVGAFDLVRGDLDNAGRLGQRALDYCTATLGTGHDFTERAQGLLGQVAIYRGDYAAARAILEPGVAAAEQKRPPGDLYRLGAQLSLAVVRSAQGEQEPARRLAEKALAESVAANGPDHQLTLSARTVLAQILAAQGETAQAAGQMSLVLEGRRREAVEGDPDLLLEEFISIKTRGMAADLREVQPLLDKAEEVFTREFGGEHTITLQVRLYQLVLLLQTGASSDAPQRADSLIRTLDRVFGPSHPLTLQARILQAQAFYLASRYREAAALLEPLIAPFASALSPQHPEVIAAKFSYASALLETGACERANEILQKLVEEADAHLGREHPNTVGSRCALVSCLCQLGDLSGAGAAWQELVASPAARINPWTYACGNAVALALMERNDVAAAQSVLLQMVPLAEAALGQENPVVITAKLGLAVNADRLGQPLESVRWWEEALAAKEHTMGSRHPETTSIAWSLFLLRWRLGQYEECRRIFQNRFLWFCGSESDGLDEKQREIFSTIRKNTPWLSG
jgi:tetratricopeptide (TPR) repeat protein